MILLLYLSLLFYNIFLYILKIYQLHLLTNAIDHNNIECIKLLLKYNVDVNLKNIYQETPLIYSYKYYPESIKLLLEHNANPNICNYNGSTILMMAVADNNNSIVELLLKYKVDINIKNNYGFTALNIAKQNKFNFMILYFC